MVSVSGAVRNDIYLATQDWLNSEKSSPRFVGARAASELVKVQEFKMNSAQVKAIISSLKRYFEANDFDEKAERELKASLVLLVELIRNHLDLFKKALKSDSDLQKALISK
jgi:hypothetical protein